MLLGKVERTMRALVAQNAPRFITTSLPSQITNFRHHRPLLPSFKFLTIFSPNPSKTLSYPSFHLRRLANMATVTSTDSSTSPVVQVKDNVNLTEKETRIFDRLLDVLRHFKLNTQLRVAGGWVRDKLLGKDCYDIDIAIDNMLGKEFCEKVNEYLSSTGEQVQGIGVIQCNPEQSKHLETARMRMFDVWIDFVNLRAENYSETSRIPTMSFGTAEDDAYRRDLTINSLFYNINTSSVEDLTGRGIEDLKFGRIVTPLPPKETFLDDPLRVLRAIRFGARFDFVLDEELKKAASSDEVRSAIADKISRERIGHEIDLMIAGNQPVKAVNYIYDLQLFWMVFRLPREIETPLLESCDRLCVACIDGAWNLIQSIGAHTFSDEQRRLCLYASMFLPLRNNRYKNIKRKVPVADYIIRNSLKLKSKDAETVVSVHHSMEKFIALIPALTSQKDLQDAELDWGKILIDVPVTSKLRILAGLLLRDIKDFWRVSLLASTLIHTENVREEISNDHLIKRTELFKLVEDAIMKLGLEKVWESKPLVNGKDIMDVLHLKPGPDVREWAQKVIEWQLAYPDADADQCMEWLMESGAKRAKTE